MARYREKILTMPQTVMLLVFFFLIAFAPWALGELELSWREGYVVAQALGMQFTPLPVATVHGEAIPNATPLFPLLARALIELGCPAELSTRILSLSGLLGLTVLVFLVTLRARKSLPAGAAAAAVMFSSILILDKASFGFANTLCVLVVFSGQLLWYYFAAGYGNWRRAWLAGFAFCALGFLLGGISTLIFFMLPLIFMRRPLGIFRRLTDKWVALGLIILGLAVLMWYLPYHNGSVRIADVYLRTSFMNGGEYLKHLLTFPADLLLRLLPWVMIAWAPFCVAFQTLDTTPLFSRFLRTVLLVDFFLLWIVPVDDVYRWMIVMPPLAILSGFYYELAVRRYGNCLRKISDTFAAILLPGSAILILLFFLLPDELLYEILVLEQTIEFRNNMGQMVQGMTAAAILLTLSAILWKISEKPPLWSYWLIILTAPLLFFHTIVRPYQAQEQPRRDRAEIIAHTLNQEGVSKGTIIYKYGLHDLYTESVHLKTPLRKISSLSELPGKETKAVYVIAEAYPNDSNRSWRNLLPEALTTRRQRFNLWRGEWQEQKDYAVPNAPLLEGLQEIPGTATDLQPDNADQFIYGTDQI